MYRFNFRKIVKVKYIRIEKPYNIKLNKLYKEIDEEYNFYTTLYSDNIFYRKYTWLFYFKKIHLIILF